MGVVSLEILADRNEAAQHNLKALGLGRRLRNAGQSIILANTSSVVVTLPEEMEDTDYGVVATVADDPPVYDVAVAFANNPEFITSAIQTTTTFTLALVDNGGAAVNTSPAGPLKVNWCVVGGRVKARI